MVKLTWILSSSALILAVVALRAVFGKKLRPGLRYALWALVLVRLLLPFNIGSSNWSVASAAQRARETEAGELSALVVSDFRVPTRTYGSAYREVRDEFAAQGIDIGELPLAEYEWRVDYEVSSRWLENSITVKDVLLYLWYIGMAVTAAVFLVSNLRFYLRLRRRRVKLDMDCPLPVYAVENLSSSCLFGNAVYVAAETVGDDTALRHVLAHELSHHRHGDHIWALLRCTALVLHWYNPLVWWAASLSRQDSELFADAGALARLGEGERERYGETLIELSIHQACRASLLCTATTMTSGKKALKERVTMIAKNPKMTAAVLTAVALLAALAAGCAFTGAEAPAESARPLTAGELFLQYQAGQPDKREQVIAGRQARRAAAIEDILENCADRYFINGGELDRDSLASTTALAVQGFCPEDVERLTPLTRLERLDIAIDGRAFPDGTGLEFLADLPNLRELHLDFERTAPTPLSLEVLNRCENLKLLDIMSWGGFDLSAVHGLHLERLYTLGASPEEVAGLGTTGYLYLWWPDGGYEVLEPMEIKSLNLNNGMANPLLIDLSGVERLSTLETLQIYERTISDMGPILETENLTTLMLTIEPTERNADAFLDEAQVIRQPLSVTAENGAILEEMDWTVPVESLARFLARGNTQLILWLGW